MVEQEHACVYQNLSYLMVIDSNARYLPVVLNLPSWK